MSELPISSPYRSTPDVVVTEAEREQLSLRLNTAYADGKLSAEDYQARLDTLFAATRLGQLVPVVDGLPPAATYNDPAIVASSGGQPGQLADTRDATRASLVAVMGVAGAVVLIALLLLVLF